MSCYYDDANKPLVKAFLNDLNSLLRKHQVSIEFSTGVLYFDKKGYCGLLADESNSISLSEDTDMTLICESDKIDN